jgi:EAL domain-containing protein (putative c-di-GMP-specific phosphodiesterase class I)
MARLIQQITGDFDQLIAAFNAALPRDRSLQRGLDGRVHAKWFNALLTSVYQPVVQAASGRVIGHEALVRCKGEGDVSISPWGVFSLAGTSADLVALDRLCRTLHTLNYFRVERYRLSLFVNVQMSLLTAVQRGFGLDFVERLSHLDLSPSGIVIDLPAEASAERKLLAQAVEDYRARGYRVAVSRAQGSLESLSGLMRLQPDIVRFDQRDLRDGAEASDAVAAVHEGKALALAEKIETHEQAERARTAGFDLLQGYYISAPAPDALKSVRREVRLSPLMI